MLIFFLSICYENKETDSYNSFERPLHVVRVILCLVSLDNTTLDQVPSNSALLSLPLGVANTMDLLSLRIEERNDPTIVE